MDDEFQATGFTRQTSVLMQSLTSLINAVINAVIRSGKSNAGYFQGINKLAYISISKQQLKKPSDKLHGCVAVATSSMDSLISDFNHQESSVASYYPLITLLTLASHVQACNFYTFTHIEGFGLYISLKALGLPE